MFAPVAKSVPRPALCQAARAFCPDQSWRARGSVPRYSCLKYLLETRGLDRTVGSFGTFALGAKHWAGWRGAGPAVLGSFGKGHGEKKGSGSESRKIISRYSTGAEGKMR
jgi:hypothetical protein